ncbi:MAG: hypothetical protein ACRDRL_24825, partial [Sciscionella sp.]
MWNARRAVLAIVAVLVLGAVSIIYIVTTTVHPPAGCTVSATRTSTETYQLGVAQADNAATIAAVGFKVGMPDHAVTIALATALQESGLINLQGGDRDSAGLFQQRPSQGWGSHAEITDPVYAATAFYHRLASLSHWADLSVTVAAQSVQHSGAPDAYAQWEPEARVLAKALTGETPATLSCHDLTATRPSADLRTLARAELGTDVLSGPHPAARGWAIAAWLVGHSTRLAMSEVHF